MLVAQAGRIDAMSFETLLVDLIEPGLPAVGWVVLLVEVKVFAMIDGSRHWPAEMC